MWGADVVRVEWDEGGYTGFRNEWWLFVRKLSLLDVMAEVAGGAEAEGFRVVGLIDDRRP